MSAREPLCNWFTPPESPCCAATPPARGSLTIVNAAGLSGIRYRIGTFTSLRQAMLDQVARPDLLAGLSIPQRAPHAQNPFAEWRPGSDGDYHTVLIELWAYLADVLTFYQERIANEAFIGTATQRESLRLLAELIDYQPGPGSAASALVAFTVLKGAAASVPARFRVGSRGRPGRAAAVFETDTALTALGAHSEIAMAADAPTNQFAPLGALQTVFGGASAPAAAATAAAHVYGTVGATFVDTFGAIRPRSTAPAFGLSLYALGGTRTTRAVVIAGINNRVTAGDYLVVAENEGTASARYSLVQVSSATVDSAAKITTLRWEEPNGASYDQTLAPTALYALRVRSGLFGSSAVAWSALPASLKVAPNDVNWDDSNSATFYFRGGTTVHLDTAVEDLKATPANPGLVVLVAGTVAVSRVIDAQPESVTGRGMTVKVTRLTTSGSLPDRTFPIRSTVVLTGSERLEIVQRLPLPDVMSGATLVLAGTFPSLAVGQIAIVEGTLFDTASNTPLTTRGSETVIIKERPIVDASSGLTMLPLRSALTNVYVRSQSVLLANVATVSQGETVRDEVLGSSDGGGFQSFPLKQTPLTYLTAPTNVEGTAVQSTLRVSVNGVRWQERPNLLDSSGDAEHFMTRVDDRGVTVVMFGDGLTAARPPSGRNNIRAQYRKGLGIAGNVGAGEVPQLVDSIPGLLKVRNPQASGGGSEPDSAEAIRTKAPASVLTFGRAVAASDYAVLARQFPGIAKAEAIWLTRDAQFQAIANPYVQLTVATASRVPLSEQVTLRGTLRAFLDGHRDPNVPLRIVDFSSVYVDVAVIVDIDARYPHEATLARVKAALGTYFSFDNRQFGESLHLSGVYAVMQRIAGVTSACVVRFRRLPDDAADPHTVRENIFVRPTELAVVQNDLSDPDKGLLSISAGAQGFADV